MARQFFIKDKNLKSENIKSGVKILNVTGTYEGGGPSDVEQWPDLLQVYNDEGGVHGGVIFDTGFPIADGLVNNSFEGYFSLGQSMEYMEENSCYLFGNASAVDPETGYGYYWGIWQAYGNINVAFGSRSEYAEFPLSEDGEEGTVSPYDLPVKWERMENVDPEATGFDSDYVYEVKIGNLVKYAPAHDERLKLFNGLNMCVFGRNVEGDPEVYSGHADSGTKSTCIYTESTDEDEISHDLDLTPYKLNDSVTFYETCNINGETEYSGPLEPILDTHGTVSNISFDVDMGTDLQVMPSDEEQHIATINGETIFPYVTVKAAGGGSDWLTDALAGNITDLSGYSLPAPNHDKQYYFLFWKYPVEGMPDFSGWTSASGDNAMDYAFYDSSIGDIDMSNLTSISGNYIFNYAFYNCSGITSVNLSSLASVTGTYPCMAMFSHCDNLQEVHLDSFPSGYNNNQFTDMFYMCPNLETVYCSGATLEGNNPINKSTVENLYITTAPSGNNNLNLTEMSGLTPASVLNVLQHLTNQAVYNRSISFYTNGLTVQDDAQGSIQAAYDAARAKNWNIRNLTITPDPGR